MMCHNGFPCLCFCFSPVILEVSMQNLTLYAQISVLYLGKKGRSHLALCFALSLALSSSASCDPLRTPVSARRTPGWGSDLGQVA